MPWRVFAHASYRVYEEVSEISVETLYSIQIKTPAVDAQQSIAGDSSGSLGTMG
jgi:hypothetical protein